MGPCTKRSVTESTVTGDKGEVAISVSLELVDSMPRLSSNTEPASVLHDTAGQSKRGMQRDAAENNFSLPGPSEPKPPV